jgi:hypothetical protein
MTSPPRPLEAVLVDALDLDDPVARFRALTELVGEADALDEQIKRERGRALLELYTADPVVSWTEIGSRVGLTGERARQLAAAAREDNDQ